MSSTLTLQIWHDGVCAQEIPFVGQKLQIGRLPENDVVINHLSASRHHALLEREGDQITVMDLGSQNGIWMDGARLCERTVVAPGASLRIGQHELRLCAVGEASAPAAVEMESIEGGTASIAAPSESVSSPAIEIEGAAAESLDDLLVPESDLASVGAATPEEDALVDFDIDDGVMEGVGVGGPSETAGEGRDEVAAPYGADLFDDVPQAPEVPSIDADELFEGPAELEPAQSLDDPIVAVPADSGEASAVASMDAGDLLSDDGPIENVVAPRDPLPIGLPDGGMEGIADGFEIDASVELDTSLDGVPSLDELPEIGAPMEELESVGENADSPQAAPIMISEDAEPTSEPLYAGLIVQRSGELDQRVAWDQPELCAGRGSDCELLLGEPEVSRRHALFLRSGDAYSVRDLGSINGVYVNDAKVDAKTLQAGDVVRIESFELTFVMERQPIGSDVHEPQSAARVASPEQEQRHLTVMGEMPPMGGDAEVATGTRKSSASELPVLDLVEEGFNELDPDAKEETGQPLRLELEVSLEQLPESLRKVLCELGDASLELPVRLKVRR